MPTLDVTPTYVDYDIEWNDAERCPIRVHVSYGALKFSVTWGQMVEMLQAYASIPDPLSEKIGAAALAHDVPSVFPARSSWEELTYHRAERSFTARLCGRSFEIPLAAMHSMAVTMHKLRTEGIPEHATVATRH